MAKVEKPSPVGKGTYAELDGAEFTGDVVLDGPVSGVGINAYIGAGKHTIENLLLKSNDYGVGKVDDVGDPSDQTYWTKPTNTNIADVNGFQSVALFPAVLDIIKMTAAVSGTTGKVLVVNVRINQQGFRNTQLRFFGNDSVSDVGEVISWLPVDYWTMERFETTLTAGDLQIFLTQLNAAQVILTSLRIEHFDIHEKLAPAFYADGDSLVQSAHFASADEESQLTSVGNSFPSLYGFEYSVDFENKSSSGNRISQIATRVEENISGRTFPVIMLDGGGANILTEVENVPATMLSQTVDMVDGAKKSSSNIVLLTIADYPLWEVGGIDPDPAKIALALEYNNLLRAEYLNDSCVKIIDLTEILTDSDFAADEIHPNISGHLKIFNAVKAVQPLPNYAETLESPITDITVVDDTNESKSTVRRAIDWTTFLTVTDATYTIIKSDATVYLDGTSNTVDATLPPLPERGEIHTVKSINATFATTLIGKVGAVGYQIDGVDTLVLAVTVTKRVQFDGVMWRVL